MNKLIDDLKNNKLQIGTGDKIPTWTQEEKDALHKALKIIFTKKQLTKTS